ncbi:hypothetical protein TrLO_g6449 [Triparma laevis f. longispina]|uniref:BHLH domain-containing protein n=1 Tax=Triparma laevis f. longispina TaxID=1714387 RepID=A0A9W6ZUD3_9STRA|nr:hypothetical protein TrLO_g6449 [Triparma laevis f. longispina]
MHPTKTMCVGKGRVGKKAGEKGGKKKKVVEEEDPMDDEKREERNLREKERSFKISAQISMLRDLLSSGGVAVPKGTKSSVLTEAANYIRVLQQHRFNSEIDRQNLVQKIRLMNSGQMGVKAQVAVRQAISENMGLQHQKPPQQHQQPSQECPPNPTSLPASKPSLPPQHPTTGMSANDYNAVFQYSLIPMAIATMGGSFLECNRRFSELSGFPRTVLSTMTVFNITSPTDLQNAFNLISKMIPTSTSSPLSPEPAILKGTLRNGESRLNCSLVKDDEGNAKYFCVQLCPTEKEREYLIMVKKKTQQHEITPYMSTTG